MSDLAFQEYERENGRITAGNVRNNISNIIEGCIRIELDRFNRIKGDILQNWIDDLLNGDNAAQTYPAIFQQVTEAIGVFSAEMTEQEKLNRITSLTSEINEFIVFGLKQSAKTRAGKCLENHLQRMFEILQIPFEPQVVLDRQKLDFAIPNLETVSNTPRNTALVECQTTLKDRFRLTQGRRQAIRQAGKFLATATGGNVITMSDDADLTTEKLAEITEYGVTLIVFQRVQEFLNDDNVISFEQFINQEIPSLQQRWNNA